MNYDVVLGDGAKEGCESLEVNSEAFNQNFLWEGRKIHVGVHAIPVDPEFYQHWVAGVLDDQSIYVVPVHEVMVEYVDSMTERDDGFAEFVDLCDFEVFRLEPFKVSHVTPF